MKSPVRLMLTACLFMARLLGDKIDTKESLCASNTLISFTTPYTITGQTAGLPKATSIFYRQATSYRDDYLHPQKEGYTCKPGSMPPTDCVRVPNLAQYWAESQQVPGVAFLNCVDADGTDVCIGTAELKVGRVMKRLPMMVKSWRVMDSDGCDGVCRDSWPADE